MPFGVAIDDWHTFRLCRESASSIHAVGLMHVLPPAMLPLDVTLIREGDRCRHEVRLGVTDEAWRSLSESKRWKALYLLATEERPAAVGVVRPNRGLASAPRPPLSGPPLGVGIALRLKRMPRALQPARSAHHARTRTDW